MMPERAFWGDAPLGHDGRQSVSDGRRSIPAERCDYHPGLCLHGDIKHRHLVEQFPASLSLLLEFALGRAAPGSFTDCAGIGGRARPLDYCRRIRAPKQSACNL